MEVTKWRIVGIGKWSGKYRSREGGWHLWEWNAEETRLNFTASVITKLSRFLRVSARKGRLTPGWGRINTSHRDKIITTSRREDTLVAANKPSRTSRASLLIRGAPLWWKGCWLTRYMP
jgi:hypothetical protein